jgi:hypothetical protein
MAKYRVTTPVVGFTGVSAGVNFTNGVAELDVPEDRPEDQLRYNARALAYFRSQGYGIEEIEPEPAEEKPKTSARTASKTDSKGADQ